VANTPIIPGVPTPINGDPKCALTLCGKIIAQVDCIKIIMQGTSACIDIQFFGIDSKPLDLSKFTEIQIMLYNEYDCTIANFWWPDVPTGCKGFPMTIMQYIDDKGRLHNEGLVRICLDTACTKISPTAIFAEILLTELTTAGTAETFGISCLQVAKIAPSKIYENGCDDGCYPGYVPGGGSSGGGGGSVSGSVGATGIQGPRGLTGATGPAGSGGGGNGATGLQGPQGAIGAQGEIGATGIQGATGDIGKQGAIGLQGASGSQGAAGTQGAIGLQGATGEVGKTGTQGAAGEQGAIGNQGATGAQGSAGEIGASGAQGAAGGIGASGAQGAAGGIGATGAGATGAQGSAGEIGATGAGATGAQGSAGEIGASGAQGAAGGIGATGAGATGAQGIQGPQGSQGSQGATGSDANTLIATNTQSNSYTLVLSDRDKIVELNSPTGINPTMALTVPPNSSVAFPIGSQVMVARGNTGKVQITAGTGVTIVSSNNNTFLQYQYSGVTLIKKDTNDWWLFGDLTSS